MNIKSFKDVGILITIAFAIVAATWTINQQINSNLIVSLEKEIAKFKENSNGQIFISDNDKGKLTPKLKNELLEAEKRKNEIISQLLLNQSEVFKPSNEIKSLMNLLESKNREDHLKSITGFFEIQEPTTALYLSNYFFSNQEEATSGYMPSISEWIRLFDSFGNDEGTLFCINLMKDGEYFNAKIGYENLNSKVSMGDNIQKYENEFKSIALMSKDALKRTWAKKILNNYENIKKNPTNTKDNRTMIQILLDIEKHVQKKK